MRASGIVPLLAGITIALAVLVGCSSESADEGSEQPAESDVSTGPAEAASPWENVVTGSRNEPLTFGDWVVIVLGAEYGRATDDVAVPVGTTRLEVEVDLTNRDSSPASVFAQDWSLTDGAGGRYTVLPSQSAEKQGESTVEPGGTEDVTMSFAVPGESENHTLRFQPPGSAGALEISLD